MKQPICKNCRFAVWTKHPSGRIDGQAPGRCTHSIFGTVADLNAGPLPVCVTGPLNRTDFIGFSTYGRPNHICRKCEKPCAVFEPIKKVKQ
jgi:hypothetical protein